MGLRILLVDGNPVFLDSVARFLDRIPGATVVGQVAHLRDATVLLARLHPELVLMDVTAARKGATEFTLAQREMPVRPRVVCLSIYDEAQYQLASAEMGNTFISKANLVAELLPVLEQMGLHVPREWQPTLATCSTIDMGA